MGAVGQARLSQILHAIAQGFVQTPIEILLFFVIVAAILLFFVLSYVIRKRKAEIEVARRESEIVDHRLGELDLTDAQLNLLDRLERHIGKGTSEHALLLSRHVFDQSAQKLRESEGATAEGIEALREKLGFPVVEGETVPVSSAEIPIGSTLVLAVGRKQLVKGALVSRAPRGITVRLDHGSRQLPPGAPVAVHYHSPLGVFSFATRVRDGGEDVVTLAHSSTLKRHQRRAFFRLDSSLPVSVASAPAAPVMSVLLNLSAGGASLSNEGMNFKRGDVITLSFSPHMEGFALPARVLRLTDRNKVLHVRFETATETQRRRLILFVRRRLFELKAGEDHESKGRPGP